VLAPTGSNVARDDRNHHTRKDAAGDDFEEHIGKGIGSAIGVAKTRIPDRLGEHQRSAEAE
jgi:hypothetical protein